ncbi:MAG: chemotaxis protein CheD [Planctomycetes bacterium]|nr:chemotaxis protein CheD [Planctomycetota bacterium]
MKTILLGVGDLGVTNKPGEELQAQSLGAGVAVIVADSRTGCIGMDHIALPDSTVSLRRAEEKPGYFADTGIAALLEAMKVFGSNISEGGMIVKLVGGANVMDPNSTFNIGRRNVQAVKEVLWKYGLGPVAEDVGGRVNRTVTVESITGKIRISAPGREAWEL